MRRLWLAVLLLAVSGPVLASLRVVSLAPSLSEIVVELDSADLLVGVLDAGERPAAIASVPSVGRYGQLDMEQLLSLKPDLLLLWPGSVGPAQRDQLKRLGIPTFVAEPHSFEQLTTQIEAIATQLGRPERGVKRAAAVAQTTRGTAPALSPGSAVAGVLSGVGQAAVHRRWRADHQ